MRARERPRGLIRGLLTAAVVGGLWGCMPAGTRTDASLVQACVEGETATALAACSRALEQTVADGERALLLFRRATLNQDTGDPAAVLADLDAAIALRPQAVSAYRLRSTMRARMGLQEPALEDVRALVRLTADTDVETLVWASYVLEELGAVAEGIEAASRALSVDPDNVPALNSRCWKRALLGLELETALIDCSRAATLHPAEAGVHDSLGFVLYRLDRPAEAIASYTQALALDPASPAAAHSYFVRGLAHLALGASAAAAADLERARALDPQIARYFRQFGVGLP